MKKEPTYSQQMLEVAYNDVKIKKMAIRKAARLHCVPESTLRFRLNHDNGLDVRGGGPTIFTREQEEALAEHFTLMARMGYGMTRWQVVEMAKNTCEKNGMKNRPTKHWFYGFLKRFPEVKIMNSNKREKVTDETINGYFVELEKMMSEYDIKDKAANIWSLGEAGISLDHTPPEVLPHASILPNSSRPVMTSVITVVGALGQTIPPYVIFNGDSECMTQEMRSSCVEGTEYKMSPSGWCNSSLFLDFIQNHFMKHITVRPCLLLYDGYSTHVTVDVIQAAREQGVHLFVLPPHSRECPQPLDISVFGPFRNSLDTECQQFLHENPDSSITGEDLLKIIGTAFTSVLTVSTIMDGFRTSGIYPYSSTAPTNTLLQKLFR